ncbi:HPr kinase/phosphorylase [Methylobrevis pamukkalensis]|uniref:HPr kinase/phosphorylase n=1 Tax=Methylobrevis pamukkalensis TaxID=1439726 RepID=UPI001FD916B1|nr:hypothetical protein [Methylobrevis pamukkalensis]
MGDGAPGATVHGCALRLGAHGVLICGRSGAGKSLLTLALLDRESDAALVADDRVRLEVHDRRLRAVRVESLAGLVELRGHGLIRLPSEPAVDLSLVVDLVAAAGVPRMPEADEARVVLAGIVLPRLRLPAMDAGMDLAAAVLAVRLVLRHPVVEDPLPPPATRSGA